MWSSVSFWGAPKKEDAKLIFAVLAFRASRCKGGGGQLSVIRNSCSPQQRSQWLSPWCEHCIETHAALWTCNYQTWSCLLRWERGQGDCVSFLSFTLFFVSLHNGVSAGLWNNGEEEGSERRRRTWGEEAWGEWDKGERDNQAHTLTNTKFTHTRSHDGAAQFSFPACACVSMCIHCVSLWGWVGSQRRSCKALTRALSFVQSWCAKGEKWQKLSKNSIVCVCLWGVQVGVSVVGRWCVVVYASGGVLGRRGKIIVLSWCPESGSNLTQPSKISDCDSPRAVRNV